MTTKTLVVSVVCLLLTACNFPSLDQATAVPAPTNPAPFLATPYALQPAAGICGQMESQTVEIFLEPGIPNPRCVQVLPSQFLTVTNRTGELVTIGLADEGAELLPDQSYTFSRVAGAMLEPGVHQLSVNPCCGGEIWLVDQ